MLQLSFPNTITADSLGISDLQLQIALEAMAAPYEFFLYQPKKHTLRFIIRKSIFMGQLNGHPTRRL